MALFFFTIVYMFEKMHNLFILFSKAIYLCISIRCKIIFHYEISILVK